MANRYFVGNGVAIGANWNRTANWSLVTGGAGGASVPGPGDIAWLDANSGDCTLDAAANPTTVNTTGYTNTLSTGPFTLTTGGGGLNIQGGTVVNSSTIILGGDFTLAGGATYTNSTGTLTVTGNCAWDATITTSFLRWETPNTTITMTAGNTVTILDELYIAGDQTNNVHITSGGNYTLDLDAGIVVKSISEASIDHMQLGAGDTAIAYFSTDNGNNDADITFTATTDKTGSVSGQWSNAATWGGAGAPANGETWSIDLGVTVTLEGNTNELAGGFVYGTLTMDGQTDGTPTPAVITMEEGESLTVIGTLDTANADDAGHTRIITNNPGGVKSPLATAGSGSVSVGPAMLFSDICLCTGLVIAAGEKLSLEGDLGIKVGLEVQATGEFYQQGSAITVVSGNLKFDGTHTIDAAMTYQGTHNVSGTSLTLHDQILGS